MDAWIDKGNELEKVEANSLIAMSNDLILKSQWPRLAINEQRLVLYMLALVKKDDHDFKTYKISIQELSNVLGCERKDLYKQFDQATSGLMSKIIRWIEAPYTQDETLHKVTWCSSARLTKGRGFVELSFDPHLKPFLLSLKGHFTLYELRSVIRLKNHYSLRLYQFLKFNQGMAKRDYRKSITVTLDWLREYLGIDTKGYSAYGSFKQRIIDPAKKDIADKTDLVFDYQPIKEGRKVTAIEFIWEHNTDYDQQVMPFMNTPLPSQKDSEDDPSDEIESKLMLIGFDDWKKVRSHLADDDWHVVFEDLQYNQEKTYQDIKSPGGWIRSRINLIEAGAAYTPSQPFQKHLKKEAAKRKRTKIQATHKEERRKEEEKIEEYRRIMDERISSQIQSLSKTEYQKLREQAEKIAIGEVPHPTPGSDQIDAAQKKFESLNKTQKNKVERKAKKELEDHFKETGRPINLSSTAGLRVFNNRIFQIVARDYPLELLSEKRYQEQLENAMGKSFRDLIRKKYKITGNHAAVQS